MNPPGWSRVSLALVLSATLSPALQSRAGGMLETVDITDPQASPSASFASVPVVPVRWDARCMPVPFRLNDTLDPIPDPLPGRPLRLARTVRAFEAAFHTWNEIRTSFVDMHLVGTTHNPGNARFDFVNELTFRPNGTAITPDGSLLAATRVVALMESRFLADGTDIDGDGDSDVAHGISSCRDVDGDGDFELPEGTYAAGTLLDADVTFNADRQNGFRFTVRSRDVDTDPRSVDLQGVATHELGHTHGLAHSLTNQIGLEDGTGSVMFANFTPTDPVAELAERVLHIEDVAASSFAYPEGSSHTGPAALQQGDIAFDHVFGVIRGEVRHGERNLPMAGASVFAVDAKSGETVGSTLSGSVRVLLDLASGATGGLFQGLPGVHLIDGRYALPVPGGAKYIVGVEAVDGAPVGRSAVNTTVNVGQSFRLHDFPEELYSGHLESELEPRPDATALVSVPFPGIQRTGIDLVTDRVLRLGNAQTVEGLLFEPAGTFFAVRIPAAAIAAAVGSDGFSVSTALFHTGVGLTSVVPRFRSAAVAEGRIRHDGSAEIDLHRPLAEIRPFFGQDNDLAPFQLPRPERLGRDLRRDLDRGRLSDLFLVLEGPDPHTFGGPAVGVLETGPFSGQSFRSTDGRHFQPVTDTDYLFQLLLTPDH